jgi:tRNA A37 methylthiotransferase MiaB
MADGFPVSATGGRRVALARFPYFTPMAPPLGLGLLKAFLNARGHAVRTYDFNVDERLWDAHHVYFKILNRYARQGANDGYSKLWSILNAHLQAYASGAANERCLSLVVRLAELFAIQIDRDTALELQGCVASYFNRIDEIISKIDLSSHDVFGVSAYTTSLATSLYALRVVKAKYPRIKTVIGGGLFADDFATGSENLERMMNSCHFIDHIVLGEGELLFAKLVEGDFGDRRLVNLADLGKETLNVDDVPTPDFDDFDMDSYSHLTIEGGRSCPFQCSFCSETIQWGSYRKKTKESLASQMDYLSRRHGNKNFFMADSLINPYINGLASELVERNIDVLFDGYLRADRAVADRTKTRAYARAGLYRARLGMETGSERLLKVMDKRTHPDTMSDVLASLCEGGIRTTTYWVVGHPGETDEDFEETLRFVNSNYKHIYELEAHPYYYFPYGQVSSRLFQAESVYPDEIVEILKYQVWDVADHNPSRAVRFERLQRMSQNAARLGIPNIYSLEDKYKAEDRWLSLSPAAQEVV